MTKKVLTLVLVREGENILLGMKKRGFGAGRWNGFGGKVQEGETVEQAATREMQEECGLEVFGLDKRGVLEFSWEGKLDEILQVHVFAVGGFSREPRETEEMKPQWYAIDAIPFSAMWPDDIHWFPLFLAGKKFTGKFLFGKDDAILEKELQETGDI